MEIFHTIATTTALALLLLAVLRYRQYPIPAPLRIGVFIAPVGMLFSIADQLLGTKAVNALLVGDNPESNTQVTYSANDTEVSHAYFVVMQLFHLVVNSGFLLIAIGLLMLLRRIIQNHTPIPPQP